MDTESEREYPEFLKPNRTDIKANIDKALTVKEYAKKFSYSRHSVTRFWQNQRVDGIKIDGHLFLLPNPPILRTHPIKPKPTKK